MLPVWKLNWMVCGNILSKVKERWRQKLLFCQIDLCKPWGGKRDKISYNKYCLTNTITCWFSIWLWLWITQIIFKVITQLIGKHLMNMGVLKCSQTYQFSCYIMFWNQDYSVTDSATTCYAWFTIILLIRFILGFIKTKEGHFFGVLNQFSCDYTNY